MYKKRWRVLKDWSIGVALGSKNLERVIGVESDLKNDILLLWTHKVIVLREWSTFALVLDYYYIPALALCCGSVWTFY